VSETTPRRVLLTGATGFVGRHLYPALVDAGYQVICGTRRARSASRRQPGRSWVTVDVDKPRTLMDALHGCHAAVYLIHGMAGGGDYANREQRAATAFAHAAAARRLQRIVYLGGMPPAGPPSKHLRSRLETGRILRAGQVPCVELQASMIIGPGSESWRIVRDLCARLPVMALPPWLSTRSQPVAIEDVVVALVHALEIEDTRCGSYPLPGPEILSAREILQRCARLLGVEPVTLETPMLSPALSARLVGLVTRANGRLASELVEGLASDLVCRGRGFWTLLPEHRQRSFEVAARSALASEARTRTLRARVAEHLLSRVARHLPRGDS